jgi:hypothetical protein
VSDVYLRDPHHECLTVDSRFEARSLSSTAIAYLENSGTSDPVITAYFGTGQTDYTNQKNLFSVCPGYAEDSVFLMEPQFRKYSMTSHSP